MPLFAQPNYSLAPKRRLFPGEEGLPNPYNATPLAPEEEKPSTMGRLFGIQRQPGELDDLGVPKPAQFKEGIGSKVMSYLLPLLAPNVGKIFLHRQNQKIARESAADDAYLKRRDQVIKQNAPTTMQKDVNWFKDQDKDTQEAALKWRQAGSLGGLALQQQKFEQDKKKYESGGDQGSVGRVRSYLEWEKNGKQGAEPPKPSRRDLEIYKGQDPKQLQRDRKIYGRQ